MSPKDLSKPKTYKEIMLALNAIDDLYKEGSIVDSVYYESLIYIAYQYIEAEYYDSAHSLILSIPEAYFTNQFLEDIKNDTNFKDTAEVVYVSLRTVGLLTPPPTTNVPQAEA